ncbi:MAG: hypothetical protein RLZ39_248 [Bacteroidota bacterium]|jgi:hypothetical protein
MLIFFSEAVIASLKNIILHNQTIYYEFTF